MAAAGSVPAPDSAGTPLHSSLLPLPSPLQSVTRLRNCADFWHFAAACSGVVCACVCMCVCSVCVQCVFSTVECNVEWTAVNT